METMREVLFKTVLNARMASGDSKDAVLLLHSEFETFADLPLEYILKMFKNEISLESQQNALEKAFVIIDAQLSTGLYDPDNIRKLKNLVNITDLKKKTYDAPLWATVGPTTNTKKYVDLMNSCPILGSVLQFDEPHNNKLNQRLSQANKVLVIDDPIIIPVWEDLTLASQAIMDHAFFSKQLPDIREAELKDIATEFSIDTTNMLPGISYQLNPDGTLEPLS